MAVNRLTTHQVAWNIRFYGSQPVDHTHRLLAVLFLVAGQLRWLVSSWIVTHCQPHWVTSGQLVVHLTEKPIPRYGKGFFLLLPMSAFSAESLTVFVQSPRAIVCINNCAHVKNPQHWQPYIVRTQENAAHTGKNGCITLLLRQL